MEFNPPLVSADHEKTGANPSVGPLRPGHPSGHSFAGRIHTDCPPSFMNLMEENGAVAALVILGILCFLPVIPYPFAAALLAVVHRYSPRLRHVLFPESHQDGEAAGAAPVPDQ